MKLDLKTADQVSDTLVATFDDAILRSFIFHNWFERFSEFMKLIWRTQKPITSFENTKN